MAQKVQFISTVLHEPRLIILDEPFSGFDPVNAQLITKEILELKQKGCTIIFSTHRMETVEDLCDHIALINKSEKILEGSKKEVKARYRSNTFSVDHKGAFDANNSYEIISQNRVEDDNFHSTLKAKADVSSNKLLSELINVTEVHAFVEKMPTMSEIFISLVKGESHE
jgi:ABC-2 type transport system ATP-binding protein